MQLSDLHSLVLTEMTDAVVLTATTGEVLFWNPGAQQVFGYSPEEAQGALLQDLVLPLEPLSSGKTALQLAIERGSYLGAAAVRARGGTLLYIDSGAKLVRCGPADAQCILWTHKDITAAKVERDAHMASAKFGALLELVPDAIVMANALGRVVLSNSQADELFGYGPDGLRGQLLEVLMPERFRRRHVGQRSGYAKAPQLRPMGAGRELFGLRASGEEFPVEISLSPVYTDEGVLVMSAIRDTTERKQIERALHEKNLELADASLAKDRFLSSMSHELRTPLNAVLGFTGTVLMGLPGPINEEQTRQLKMVQSSARHLLSLINDILDLTKIASGAVEIAPQAFDAMALMNDVIGMFGPLAESKNIALLLTSSREKLMVTSDRRAVQQILINLVNNAVKFTDRGQVQVSVRCDEGTGGMVRIVVEDTGIGIETDKLCLLFRPFTQLDQGTTRKFEGTGLGLHVCERLATLIGATISVQSTYGAGSVFTFDLPTLLPRAADLPARVAGADDGE